MAVTPAGAEVSNAVATNWKKIWKKNLKPLADRRYYKKSASDAKYATKAESAAGDAASNAATDSKLSGYYKKTETYSRTETYSKAEADAKYAAAGSSYSKAASDAKYAAYQSMSRGTFWATSDFAAVQSINWGSTYSASPTPHVIMPGDPNPDGCSGTSASPVASPGNLCVFVTGTSGTGTVGVYKSSGSAGTDPFGANVLVTAAGNSYLRGSWASAPLAIAAVGARVATAERGGESDAYGVVR